MIRSVDKVRQFPGARLHLAIPLVLVSAAFLWLFLSPVNKGEGITPRLFSAFWNLGHFGLFFIWSWLLATVLTSWFGLRGITLLIIGLIAALVAGFAIEDAQFDGGARSASIDDLILDVIGAFVALGIHPSCRQGLSKVTRTVLLLAAMGLTLYAVYPFSKLLVDTLYQHRQFPVLLDFSTPLEFGRAKGSATRSMRVREGNDSQSLLVTFSPHRYSMVGFADFPSDWRGYGKLWMNVYNPQDSALELHCRIQDQTTNRHYSDRYNEKFSVEPGKQRIAMNLQAVRISPRGREMDMSRIDLVLCYTVYLKREQVLWIDRIALVE